MGRPVPVDGCGAPVEVRGLEAVVRPGAAQVSSAVGFGHPTPDAVGLADGEGVVSAFGQHRALFAELFRLSFAARAGVSAFAVGGEEHRGVGAAAGSAVLPVLFGRVGFVGAVGCGHGSVVGRCRVVRWWARRRAARSWGFLPDVPASAIGGVSSSANMVARWDLMASVLRAWAVAAAGRQGGGVWVMSNLRRCG